MEVDAHTGENVNLNFENATKEELIQKIRTLQGQVKQLRKRQLEDQSGSGPSKRLTKKQRQGKKERPFDFSLHPKRHVALKITYLGWDYQGLACQDDTNETIEAHLFDALIRTKLIESRATSNYHRCGRTDKGVSAFSQVISIDLRCKENAGTGVIPLENSVNIVGKNGCDSELDYCKILNSVLPKEIRVLAWSPVRTDFSARFDCKRRTYRYYLPLVDLDIESMKTAAQFLIGEHDYRNFCKLDTSGEKTTTRRILDVDLTLCTRDDSVEENYRLGVLKLTGQAFLWHQIRCIVAVLILVGKGLEEPEVVQQLLDISKNPKKPQYAMAVDFPLILFDVNHGNEIEWKYCEDNVYCVLADLQRIWIQNAVKSQMILDVMRTLEKDEIEAIPTNSSGLSVDNDNDTRRRPKEHLNSILMGSKPRNYQKLLERPQCEKVPVQR